MNLQRTLLRYSTAVLLCLSAILSAQPTDTTTTANPQQDSIPQNENKHSKKNYMATPWRPMEPFYQEEHNRKEMFLDMLDWKHGGHARFGGEFTYNFSLDTAAPYTYNFGNPSQTDVPFDISYTHRFNKIVWAGGGITRSYVGSRYFDSLYVDRKGWWGRMGFNLHVAVPGFKYELYRDPRLIPYYGRYDRQALQNLTPNGKGEYTKLEVYQKSSFVGEDASGDSTNRAVTIPPGVGHNLTFKISKLSYTLVLDPFRYTGPIQHIRVNELPFFKGEWGMGLVILPSSRVVPQLSIGFYTIKIPLGDEGKYQLNITPVTAELEIWSSNEFFFSAAVTTEFLHLKKRKDYMTRSRNGKN